MVLNSVKLIAKTNHHRQLGIWYWLCIELCTSCLIIHLVVSTYYLVGDMAPVDSDHTDDSLSVGLYSTLGLCCQLDKNLDSPERWASENLWVIILLVLIEWEDLPPAGGTILPGILDCRKGRKGVKSRHTHKHPLQSLVLIMWPVLTSVTLLWCYMHWSWELK